MTPHELQLNQAAAQARLAALAPHPNPVAPQPAAVQAPAPAVPTASTALNNYQQTQQNPGQLQAIDMMQADPTSMLQNIFYQLPAYQLLYGPNANQSNPVDRFKQDPGYQYAQDEAARQMQRNGARNGLLDSGSMQRSLAAQSQGIADQGYQRFLGQQQGIFSDYQNRLASLAQMGAANTGNQNQLATAGAQNANYTNAGQYNLATGENLSTLFANQGSFGANAMMNTAAAQSNNMLQGAALQTQIDSSNAASRAGSMNSLFSGLGSAFGKGGAFGAK